MMVVVVVWLRWLRWLVGCFGDKESGTRGSWQSGMADEPYCWKHPPTCRLTRSDSSTVRLPRNVIHAVNVSAQHLAASTRPDVPQPGLVQLIYQSML